MQVADACAVPLACESHGGQSLRRHAADPNVR